MTFLTPWPRNSWLPLYSPWSLHSSNCEHGPRLQSPPSPWFSPPTYHDLEHSGSWSILPYLSLHFWSPLLFQSPGMTEDILTTQSYHYHARVTQIKPPRLLSIFTPQTTLSCLFSKEQPFPGSLVLAPVTSLPSGPLPRGYTTPFSQEYLCYSLCLGPPPTYSFSKDSPNTCSSLRSPQTPEAIRHRGISKQQRFTQTKSQWWWTGSEQLCPEVYSGRLRTLQPTSEDNIILQTHRTFLKTDRSKAKNWFIPSVKELVSRTAQVSDDGVIKWDINNKKRDLKIPHIWRLTNTCIYNSWVKESVILEI